MRTLTIIMIIAAAGMLLGGERSVTRHETTITADGRTIETSLRIVRDSDGPDYATWERNGVGYITRDAAVLDALQAALKKHGDISRAHAELGRRHAELGREHARVRNDEVRRRELERRRQELEREQQALERKRHTSEGDTNDAIDAIFKRALKEGKAKKD